MLYCYELTGGMESTNDCICILQSIKWIHCYYLNNRMLYCYELTGCSYASRLQLIEVWWCWTWYWKPPHHSQMAFPNHHRCNLQLFYKKNNLRHLKNSAAMVVLRKLIRKNVEKKIVSHVIWQVCWLKKLSFCMNWMNDQSGWGKDWLASENNCKL